jgi:hypothetical protein
MGFFLFLLVTATLLIRPAEQFPELRGVRIYEALILLCFAFSFGSVLEQFTVKNLETRPISLCVIGLLVAVVASQLAQGNAVAAGNSGFEFFKLVVYFVLLVGNVTTVFRLRAFVMCFGMCAVVFVTLAVLQFHEVITLPPPEPVAGASELSKNSEFTSNAFVTDLELNPETGMMEEYRRLRGSGTFRDPNDISLLLTTGIFIALFCLADTQQGAFRLLWLGPMVLFVYALSLTHSRGGLLGLLAGSAALFYARFGWRGTVLLGAPLLPVVLAFFGGRMASFSASEGTGQARVQIWSDAIAAMMTSPIFGIGMGEMGSMVGKVAHNSFLNAYAELGLVGGTMFFGAFFCAGLTLLWLLNNRQAIANPELRRLLPFLAALLASYIVGILSLSRVDAVPTYLLLGLVAAAANVAMGRVPALVLKFDGRLMQRMAFASVAFLSVTYMFVRVFKT